MGLSSYVASLVTKIMHRNVQSFQFVFCSSIVILMARVVAFTQVATTKDHWFQHIVVKKRADGHAIISDSGSAGTNVAVAWISSHSSSIEIVLARATRKSMG